MSYDYNILIAGTAYRYVYPLINYKLFSICRHYSTFQVIWKYQKKWRIFFNTIEQNSYQFTESWKKINISRKIPTKCTIWTAATPRWWPASTGIQSTSGVPASFPGLWTAGIPATKQSTTSPVWYPVSIWQGTPAAHCYCPTSSNCNCR